VTSRTTTSANDDRAFAEELAELRAAAACVPDDVLVCLVSNMVTEEAMPTYQSMFNRTDGVGNDTGASTFPLARWIRGWTAEENRTLSKICVVVAGDERRHETAYTKASAELFGVDPDDMVRALAYVMLGKVTMPCLLMSDTLPAHTQLHTLARRPRPPPSAARQRQHSQAGRGDVRAAGPSRSRAWRRAAVATTRPVAQRRCQAQPSRRPKRAAAQRGPARSAISRVAPHAVGCSSTLATADSTL